VYPFKLKPAKPDRLSFPDRQTRQYRSAMSATIRSQVDFSPWFKKIKERDRIIRMIGKTRATRDMSLSTKKRVALSIMSSPLQRMSIGAKQYAMAIAVQEAQKQVKVQPLSFFTMGDGENGGGGEEELPVRRIHWGTADTKLISYDIPIEVPDETNPGPQNKKIMTERMMKIDHIHEISKNVKNNLSERCMEKHAAGTTSMA